MWVAPDEGPAAGILAATLAVGAGADGAGAEEAYDAPVEYGAYDDDAGVLYSAAACDEYEAACADDDDDDDEADG